MPRESACDENGEPAPPLGPCTAVIRHDEGSNIGCWVALHQYMRESERIVRALAAVRRLV
jgi:hypothetical protein